MTVFDAAGQFVYDARLGIPIPRLTKDWDEFTRSEQAAILMYWEEVCGAIPDRIFAFEREIGELQRRMNEEEDFGRVIAINWDIAELASRINDLNIYFRLNRDTAVRAHQ